MSKNEKKQASIFSFFKQKNNDNKNKETVSEKEKEIVVESEKLNNNTSILSKLSNYIRNKSTSFLNKTKDTTVTSNSINKSDNTISLSSINEVANCNKSKIVTISASSILSNNNTLNHAHIDNDDDPACSSNIYKKTLEPCRPSLELIKKADPKTRFTQSMYDKNNWLEYSLSSKKAYCFHCRMFGFESMEPAWVIYN
jgi:hypothetical protein